MEWLAKEMPKIGGKLMQSEDEIAAITAAIGASFAGVNLRQPPVVHYLLCLKQ